MTKPLALVCYANLMPGTQLPNRLQDLGYRVTTVPQAADLAEETLRLLPMLVILDLGVQGTDVCEIIRQLRSAEATRHIPVLAFSDSRHRKLQDAARAAGATLVAGSAALLPQLPQLLEQVLEIQ
jgi:CheY-like chemotaxis protein